MPKWQKISYWVTGVLMGGVFIANGVLFSLPDKDESGNDVIDEYSSLPFPEQYLKRLKNKIFVTKKSIEEPFSDRLLPDPLEEPYIQPKYTICIELTGLLVHSTWSHKYGWRFQKRPGIDMFMHQIGYPNFELVVYTIENGMTFFPIIDGLDPQNQFINYRLFRDATRFVNGHPTKDVNSLNRDPKRVIFIDWNKDSVALGMNNSLILPKWEGENSDTSLIGLAHLLGAIKDTNVDDVRDVLSYYRTFDDPIGVFRENQRKLQEETLAYEEKMKSEAQKKQISGFSGFSGLSFMRRK
jgi:import inner membrane translocase subunit TIM50